MVWVEHSTGWAAVLVVGSAEELVVRLTEGAREGLARRTELELLELKRVPGLLDRVQSNNAVEEQEHWQRVQHLRRKQGL